MNSKKKGNRGELEFSKFCNELGYTTHRTQQYNGRTELGQADIVGIDGLHIEVKRVEKLNIYDAIEQAMRDTKGNIPIVAHRKNNKQWLITLNADDFLNKIYKER
jgi:Holliday junction resolvase